MLRLLRGCTILVRLCGLDAPFGETLTGTWPGDDMRAPLDGKDGKASLVRAADLRGPLAEADVPELAPGTPVALMSPCGARPDEEVREVRRAVADAGTSILHQARREPADGVNFLFRSSTTVGVFTAQAAPGSSPERLRLECGALMGRTVNTDPGAFTPWAPWSERNADDPVVVLPEDGTTGPTAVTFFGVPDRGRADSAIAAAMASWKAGVPPFPETPS